MLNSKSENIFILAEYRSILLQRDEHIWVRGKADEVMPPSSLVPTMQVCGGECYVVCLNRLALGLATSQVHKN